MPKTENIKWFGYDDDEGTELEFHLYIPSFGNEHARVDINDHKRMKTETTEIKSRKLALEIAWLVESRSDG